MNIFSKINQYLLERYPNVWNTKIVWVFMIALCFHILFFAIGLISHANPTSLQERYIISDFFTNGLILANIIVSILILVGWLVYMFKNNAFKNFYPTSSFKLFGQFAQYFIIIFVSTTFYYSYMFGFQLYIKYKYGNEKMISQIELINKVYPFFSHDPDKYLINQKQYPEIFSTLFCETDPSKINHTQKYYSFYDSQYQFNDLYVVEVVERDSIGRFIYPEREAINKIPLAFLNENDTKCLFYFKKNAVDLSPYIPNANLNYGNFSDIFYASDKVRGNDMAYPYYQDELVDSAPVKTKEGQLQNKATVELIERNNKEEFRDLFINFLQLADSYKIKHNLTADKWLELVYNQPNFDVKHFILNQNPSDYDIDNYYSEDVFEVPGEGNTLEDQEVTKRRQFIKKATTKNYIDSDRLRILLENVDEVKNSDFVANSYAIYLWIAFVLSSLLFSFRVTNLRALLFSLITSGVITLISSLIFVVTMLTYFGDIKFVLVYYILILGAFIIGLPILVPKFGSKLFRSILINISINGFVYYLFLVITIINLHQQEACRIANINTKEYVSCKTIIDSLDSSTWSWILILLGFIFIYFYSSVIKKWKASAE